VAREQTFLSFRVGGLLRVPLKKIFSFYYCELPSKMSCLYIILNQISMAFIFCFIFLWLKQFLCLTALRVKYSSNRCYKSIACSISRTLRPRWWILIRFSCMAFSVAKISFTFRSTRSTWLILTFVFKFLPLHDPRK